MLDRDTIIKTLRSHEAELRAKGVEGLYLFGSVARGDAGPNSDVDLFFDYRSGLGWEVIGLMDELTQLAENRGDVTTRGGLHPRLKDRIESESIQVF